MQYLPVTSELIPFMYLVLQLILIKCNIGGKTREVRKPFLQYRHFHVYTIFNDGPMQPS